MPEGLMVNSKNRKPLAEAGFWALITFSSYSASRETTATTWAGVVCLVLALGLLYWCRRLDSGERKRIAGGSTLHGNLD